MEFGVVDIELTEKEIRPKDLLENYTALMTRENEKVFSQPSYSLDGCPGCGSRKVKDSFVKCSVQYSSCQECKTLFVPKRIEQKNLTEFFRTSEARRFWLEKIYSNTSQKRQAKIVEPLLNWMQTIVEENFNGKTVAAAELMPNHWAYLEGHKKSPVFQSLSVVEPQFDSMLCPLKSLSASVEPLNTSNKFSAVLLMDTISRVEKPITIFQWAAEHLVEGGLCFLTMPLSSGFDVMILGEKAEFLMPPDHMTLFSLEGFEKLLQGSPFEIIELSTPGVLDVKNVKDSLSSNLTQVPEFVRYMVETRKDSNLSESFQEFLQVNRLSSRGRAVLRKKSNKRA